MTRNDARRIFFKAGVSYADLTRANLQTLRNMINEKMKTDACLHPEMKMSYRCKQRPVYQPNLHDRRFWAAIRCRSFYFDDREAISFNDDGFIGFGGWADSKNIKPILDGFVDWVGKIKAVKLGKNKKV